jgi:NAD(P)-dependent dehydrogenase (short-subunit alcohol dehydrogenase family)
MSKSTGSKFRLDGEVAAVTGGATGLGRAIAARLAAQGAHVAVLDLDGKGASETATIIGKAGGSAESHVLDVTDEAAVDTVLDTLAGSRGRIDVLVNNAGIAQRLPATEIPLAVWDKVMGVNTTGTFLCARAAARHMIAGGTAGRIVNIASIMGFSGGIYPNVAYNTSKGAVVNLTRALAIEWGPHRIRVNAVGPTYVRTNLTTGLFASQETVRDIAWFTPMGREAEPEDIANAVLFLASHQSEMITGHTLPVDGGFLAW